MAAGPERGKVRTWPPLLVLKMEEGARECGQLLEVEKDTESPLETLTGM